MFPLLLTLSIGAGPSSEPPTAYSNNDPPIAWSDRKPTSILPQEKSTSIPGVIVLPASSFPSVAPTRSIIYNPSHNCPSCGRSQYYVSGRGPIIGSHTHTCTLCRTTWYH